MSTVPLVRSHGHSGMKAINPLSSARSLYPCCVLEHTWAGRSAAWGVGGLHPPHQGADHPLPDCQGLHTIIVIIRLFRYLPGDPKLYS